MLSLIPTELMIITQPQHRIPVAANTLNRQFTVESPNRVWAGDPSYAWTAEGWPYLALIGWAMSTRLSRDLAQHPLTMALQHRTPTRGLLHYSDRGSVRCRRERPASGRRAPRHQHQPQRQLLGQRPSRKLLRDTKASSCVIGATHHGRADPCQLFVTRGSRRRGCDLDCEMRRHSLDARRLAPQPPRISRNGALKGGSI